MVKETKILFRSTNALINITKSMKINKNIMNKNKNNNVLIRKPIRNKEAIAFNKSIHIYKTTNNHNI